MHSSSLEAVRGQLHSGRRKQVMNQQSIGVERGGSIRESWRWSLESVCGTWIPESVVMRCRSLSSSFPVGFRRDKRSSDDPHVPVSFWGLLLDISTQMSMVSKRTMLSYCRLLLEGLRLAFVPVTQSVVIKISCLTTRFCWCYIP